MPANIVVPEVGESIVDARVAKWLRKEGETVSVGDPLVELETDKIDLEVAAPQAGVLSRIDRKDGDDVKVGEVLGMIEDAVAGTAARPAPPVAVTGSAAAQKPAAAPVPAAPAPTATAVTAEKTRATPTARRAAQEREVDLTRVQGSGDAGRVMRRDVEQAAAGAESPRLTSTPEPAKARATPAVSEPLRPALGDRTEE